MAKQLSTLSELTPITTIGMLCFRASQIPGASWGRPATRRPQTGVLSKKHNWHILHILCNRRNELSSSKIGSSSANQCTHGNLHHVPQLFFALDLASPQAASLMANLQGHHFKVDWPSMRQQRRQPVFARNRLHPTIYRPDILTY